MGRVSSPSFPEGGVLGNIESVSHLASARSYAGRPPIGSRHPQRRSAEQSYYLREQNTHDKSPIKPTSSLEGRSSGGGFSLYFSGHSKNTGISSHRVRGSGGTWSPWRLIVPAPLIIRILSSSLSRQLLLPLSSIHW